MAMTLQEFKEKFPSYKDWDDDRLLMDVDTPEDYDKLIRHG